MEIIDILFNDPRDILKLSQLVAIMLREHALRADNLVAELAEVLDLLLWVPPAEHFIHLVLLSCAKPSEESTVLLLLLN